MKEEFGFPKSELHAQAYWTEGRAMGTDRTEANAEAAPEVAVAESAAAQPVPAPAAAAPARGTWRAQGAGRLLSPLKTPLIVSGVLQAIITLIQLAPFVLLVELARLLLAGSEESRLWTLGLTAVWLLGLGALLGAGLTLAASPRRAVRP